MFSQLGEAELGQLGLFGDWFSNGSFNYLYWWM